MKKLYELDLGDHKLSFGLRKITIENLQRRKEVENFLFSNKGTFQYTKELKNKKNYKALGIIKRLIEIATMGLPGVTTKNKMEQFYEDFKMLPYKEFKEKYKELNYKENSLFHARFALADKKTEELVKNALEKIIAYFETQEEEFIKKFKNGCDALGVDYEEALKKITGTPYFKMLKNSITYFFESTLLSNATIFYNSLSGKEKLDHSSILGAVWYDYQLKEESLRITEIQSNKRRIPYNKEELYQFLKAQKSRIAEGVENLKHINSEECIRKLETLYEQIPEQGKARMERTEGEIPVSAAMVVEYRIPEELFPVFWFFTSCGFKKQALIFEFLEDAKKFVKNPSEDTAQKLAKYRRSVDINMFERLNYIESDGFKIEDDMKEIAYK